MVHEFVRIRGEFEFERIRANSNLHPYQQELEAIPQHERMAKTPTANNLCPIFAIHQIRALAMGEQLQPAIRNETEAQAAHAALVHEILSALRSAIVRLVRHPPEP